MLRSSWPVEIDPTLPCASFCSVFDFGFGFVFLMEKEHEFGRWRSIREELEEVKEYDTNILDEILKE